MKNKEYRIIEIENKAGGKLYYAQYQHVMLFGLVRWWNTFYYHADFQFLTELDRGYTEYCDAVNAIKYHKMFGDEKDVKQIHNMSDI